jgi:hypothetical protein
MKQPLRLLALAAALTVGAHAHAFTDPADDFLASFTGSHVGALDILASDVTFDPAHNSFALHARTNGAIAGASGVAYVFGFNRGGTANSPFGAIGVPGVSFNATATMRANGTGSVGANPFNVSIVGDEIFGTVSASLLPGNNGTTPDHFTWALWAIDGNITGLPRNADFGPAANISVATVPEPETYALMFAGLGVVGVVARRRSQR